MAKKNKKVKRGFLLHAFGNRDLDYGKLAVCCALSIKTNLKNNHITLVADEGTRYWLSTTISPQVLSSSFDNIIIAKEKYKSGRRKHFDSPWFNFTAEFNNQNRVLSYKYSPYDETILLDTDYLVMNDNLDKVWNNREDILINKNVVDLKNEPFGAIEDQRVSPYGIPLYWATIVYFKKSSFSKAFFDLVDYIRQEYNFFQFLYGFKKGFYRNDYSFSIASHIMGNIQSFPESSIITSYQQDGIAEVIDSKELILLSHSVKEPWKDTLVNMKGLNIHIMNKREILRVSDKFIASCMEKI